MKGLSDAAHRLEGQKMFQILAQAKNLEKNGKRILHFEIGDPDFTTPQNVIDACCKSLQSGRTHYVPSSGLLEFREVAAEITEKSRGFKPSVNQILVTPGANVQIYYAIACTVNPGEEVIITDPAFVSYNSIINLLGCKPVKVPLFEENQFRLSPNDLEKAITPKTRMIIINSPHNPTGSVMTEEDMKNIYIIAEKYDLYLLSDEVYARMIYPDPQVKFSSPSKFDECKERTIIAHSFSKSYAMTGWRIGGITAPEELIERMGLLLETTTSCVSPFIQDAAIEALVGSQQPITDMIIEYKKRRDVMVEGLNSIKGISCIEPKGTFYAFANIKETGLSSEEFSRIVLDKIGVATCPGNYFGDMGEGYIRFCYANSIENIVEGLEKLNKFLN